MRGPAASIVCCALLVACARPAAVPARQPAGEPVARLARSTYERELAPRLVPLLQEVVRFETVHGNAAAHAAQQAWLLARAAELGFTARDAGKVVEIDLPGPPGAPVLGLVVHGDVVPVDPSRWSFPPFEARVQDGWISGRGTCDDKGPLVQALLAMRALAATQAARTHTVRLLVGSDEESDNTDMKEYLEANAPPDLSLVLDYRFPVVVGEKAWTGFRVRARPGRRPGTDEARFPYEVVALEAGLSPSIVPDQARIELRALAQPHDGTGLIDRLRSRPLPEGTRASFETSGPDLVIRTTGKSAHGGANLEGGRNALVALARLLEDQLPPSGEDDLLELVRIAGKDLHGTGLGLTQDDPTWGRYAVNVATITRTDDGPLELTIVLRRPPPTTGPLIRDHLRAFVERFNETTGASLQFDPDFYYADEPFSVPRDAPIVQRLLAAYERATGDRASPVVSGGGTYAKRIPRAIAFGTWFPGKPYPGHDVDEKMPIADLHRGVHVLIEALADLATSPPVQDPFGTGATTPRS